MLPEVSRMNIRSKLTGVFSRTSAKSSSAVGALSTVAVP